MNAIDLLLSQHREVADLFYHTLVLLAERGVPPAQVMDVLRSRHEAAQGQGSRIRGGRGGCVKSKSSRRSPS